MVDPDDLLAEAVALAKEADAVIAIVGLNSDWETEGNDRTTLTLPGRTDELVEKLTAANPKTVVVTESVGAFQYSLSSLSRHCRDRRFSCRGQTKFLPLCTRGISGTRRVKPSRMYSSGSRIRVGNSPSHSPARRKMYHHSGISIPRMAR